MTRLAVCMVVVAMLFTMGVATAQEGLEGESWTDRICVSGYFHFRYEDTDNAKQDDQFDFRRMFLTFRGDCDERTTGIITLSRVGPDDPNIDLYNAFVDYDLSERYAIQVGQVPTWFGLEAWEGSSVRLPFERAFILAGPPIPNAAGFAETAGVYFEGAPDRGVWLRRNPETPDEPLAILGVCNGQFRDDDQNGDKNVEVHLKWEKDWGQLGASWMDGTYVDGNGDESDRNAVGLYARKFADPWGFQTEWADADVLGADRDGWYAMATYAAPNGNDTAFLRYETYNVDNGPEYDGVTVGVRHKVYDSSYVTVQYTDGDWDNVAGDVTEDLLGVQWQYNFR